MPVHIKPRSPNFFQLWYSCQQWHFLFWWLTPIKEGWHGGWHCTVNSTAAQGFTIIEALVLTPTRLWIPPSEMGLRWRGVWGEAHSWMSFLKGVLGSLCLKPVLALSTANSLRLSLFKFCQSIWSIDEMTNISVTLLSKNSTLKSYFWIMKTFYSNQFLNLIFNIVSTRSLFRNFFPNCSPCEVLIP